MLLPVMERSVLPMLLIVLPEVAGVGVCGRPGKVTGFLRLELRPLPVTWLHRRQLDRRPQ